MPFSDLRSQFLKLGDTQTLRVILDDLSQKRIVFWKNGQIGLAGHELSLKPKEQEMAGRIEQAFKQARFSSPLEEDVCRELDLNHDLFKNMIESLLQQEILARLSKKVIYHRDTLEEARQLVLEHLQQKGSMTIAELRDKLDLSRKYAQAILEHFDRIGLTKRRDDRHVLAKPAGG
jgi:selenocysteine-specific elongation factor